MASLEHERLAFGSVAELYDRARPSYPAPVIDGFVEALEPIDHGYVVEVGAGTGKATVLLAGRGLEIVALEPDPRMASVARAACSGFPRVTVETVDFEHWHSDRRARAIVSAQAWHWVDRDSRYDLASARLADGGLLAAIWTLPDWERIALRDELRAVYARCVPELEPAFPMHPASAPSTIDGAWQEEIEASRGMTEPETIDHVWQQRYSPRAYTELISTHQDHVLLDSATRSALMADVERAISEHGGSMDVTFCTRLCLARRA